MAVASAQLNSHRESPRKVRLVADAIRGKSALEAKKILTFITKRASGPLHKLLNSAISNAKDNPKNSGISENSFFVKSITVDKGQTLFRRRPVAHGASHPIHKRTSHIKITLEARS